jgi:pimeloyl-ACP methyl ester carboxylesterase
MPGLVANGIKQHYEMVGEGVPLVFIHGAFVDSQMWDPQFIHFAKSHTVLRYDLRGHGKTGRTSGKRYTIDLFADDLESLLDALELDQVFLCGLSLGGMIAQSFAVRHNHRLKALILADTAVSVRLTLSDKFQRYILAPKWLMFSTIRWMTVPQFVNFSFKIAQWTRNTDWFGRDPETAAYVRDAMLKMHTDEYIKIYDAIYEFDLLDLSQIRVPTLILNGQYESKAVFRHTEEMVKWIPRTSSQLIPGAGHTSNLENAVEFNRKLDEFLSSLLMGADDHP